MRWRTGVLLMALLALLTLAAAPADAGSEPEAFHITRRPRSTPTTTPPPADPLPGLDELLIRHPRLRDILCQEPAPTLREGEFLLPIFMYHQFDSPKAPLSVSARDFEEQLAPLKALNYTTLTFGELSKVLSGTQTLPPRAVVLTFDDGWKSQYQVAYPLLLRYGMRGTFFVLAHRTRGSGEMSLEALQELSTHGMEIGSHTLTHPMFDEKISAGRAWSEIHGSREILQEQLGVPVLSFAYPYSSRGAGAQQLVARAGYEVGAGTGGLIRHHPRQRYCLSRVEVNRGTTLEKFAGFLPWRAPELCRPPAPPATPAPKPRPTSLHPR